MPLDTHPSLVRCSHCHHVFAGGAALVNHERRCSRVARVPIPAEAPGPRRPLSPAALSDLSDLDSNPRDSPPLLIDAAQNPADPVPPRLPPEMRRCHPVYGLPPSLLQPFRLLVTTTFQQLLDAATTPEGVTAAHVGRVLELPGFVQEVSGASNIRKTRRRLAALLDPNISPAERPVPQFRAADDARRPARADPSGLPTRRLRQLVNTGCLSRAVKLVESAQAHNGLAAADEETRTALRALFPPRSPEDDLPNAAEVAVPNLVFTQDLVDDSLTTLPKQSAAGFSGWSYDLIRQLTAGSNEEAVHLRRVIRLFAHLYMRGEAGPPQAWHQDRLVPLQKTSGGLRPIAIGEAWPRVVTRLAARALSPQLTPHLLPWQWGIGSEGGPEVVAHAAHLFESVVQGSPGHAIQVIDFRNAFNCLRRRPIFFALERLAPSLIPWFRWAYGDASMLSFSDGLPAASCGTGVRQGDPLACLLFCLGTLDMLQSLARRFPDVHILADLDDITVMGPTAQMPAVVAAISTLATPLGLDLHPQKSSAWIDSPRDVPAALVTTLEGHRLMGTYVGTHEFQSHRTRQSLEDNLATVDLIAALDPTIAFPMLQCCINTRPVYLARTTGPWIMEPLAPDFDARIDQALLRLQGAPYEELPAPARALRSLPQADSGLGLPRLTLICEPAWVASFTQACSSLSEHIPALLHSCSAPPLRPRLLDALTIVQRHIPDIICSDDEDDDSRRFRFWPVSPDAPVPREVTPRQKALCAPIAARTLATLETALQEDQRGRAWRLSNAFKGSGCWFTPTPRAAAHLLTPEVFRSALATRLLLPATWAPPGAYTACTHCSMLPGGDRAQDHRFHGLNCRLGQGARTTRHDAVRDALAQALSRLFGSHAVQREPRLGPGLKEPDISLATPAGVIHIDVSIVNPTAERHLAAHSDTTPLAAATVAEADKRRQYRHTLETLGLREDALVPFVVEATGRLGTAAQEFLSRLSTLPGRRPSPEVEPTLKFMLMSIAVSIARGNAFSMARSRDHTRVLMRIP